MNIIKLNDIIRTYQRIDLYRAKYRHEDFTPYAWCFHGDKRQAWLGECKNGLLEFTDTTDYRNTLSIEAALYKYVTLRLAVKNSQQYDLSFHYTVDGTSYSLQMKTILSSSLQTVLIDMSSVAEWTGTVTGIGFSLSATVPGADNRFLCEYIKIDKENVFAGIGDDIAATIADFNEIKDDLSAILEGYSGEFTSPDAGDYVKEFVDTAKRIDIDTANEIISSLPPYNGCATCDNHTCSCNVTTFGYVPCLTCDGCNQQQGCSSCDSACYEESLACSCNMSCDRQPVACSCDSTCYGYSACTCDGSCNTCYAGNVTCGVCHTWKYMQVLSCNCDSTCNGYSCYLQAGQSYITLCKQCYARCDAAANGGVRSNDGFGNCVCNARCHLESPGTLDNWTCVIACDWEMLGCMRDSSANTVTCSICDEQCHFETTQCSSCYSGYQLKGCTASCDYGCYGQPISCSCNQTCNIQERGCTCNGVCYGYESCKECDGCNQQQACSCNQTCHQESCGQCHGVKYSEIPI